MKTLKPTPNIHRWPRKRDLVIRIADWTRQSPETGEPSYDVEVYVGGVYDYDLSKQFTLYEHKTKEKARELAVEFAAKQIAALL